MQLINTDLWKSLPRRMCGIMTGTSLDGIDVCIADFYYKDNITFDIKAYNTIKFPLGYKNHIHNLLNSPNLDELSQMNFLLPKLYFEAVQELCKASSIDIDSIDAISIHGQTIWHQPIKSKYLGYYISSTLQIGNPSVLAKLSGKVIISDFRSADIALAGQGAPLIPAFDYDFLRSEKKNIIALNIGGISNVTLLKAGCNKDEVLAFDTGPGNMLIDILTKKFLSLDYDNGGGAAAAGEINYELLNKLLDDEYFKISPPKSSGREYFNDEFIEKYTSGLSIKPNDLIATFSALTFKSIREQILKFGFQPDKLIVSGGGAKNSFILEGLKNELPNTNVLISDEINIPLDAKEALAFAYFGYRTLCGLPSNMPSVTGAKSETILGIISL